MTAGQLLLAAVALVKEHTDLIPDETVREVTGVALDLLGTGAAALQDKTLTPDEFRAHLAQQLPDKWEMLIREKFAQDKDTDPSLEAADKIPE